VFRYGSCSVCHFCGTVPVLLQPCDDGIACTRDWCDPRTGECKHKYVALYRALFFGEGGGLQCGRPLVMVTPSALILPLPILPPTPLLTRAPPPSDTPTSLPFSLLPLRLRNGAGAHATTKIRARLTRALPSQRLAVFPPVKKRVKMMMVPSRLISDDAIKGGDSVLL
jgi:hypothetical protein